MKRLMSLAAGRAGRFLVLASVLLIVRSGAALAEATGVAAPAAASAETAGQAEPSQGSCQPIGLTASGEIVYPFQCKAMLERRKAAEPKPAAVDDRPAAAKAAAVPAVVPEKPVDQTAAIKSQDSPMPPAPKPAIEPVPAVGAARGAELAAQDRGIGPPGCTHFRSYEPTTATYLAFDGQRHPCLEGAARAAKR